MLTVEVYIDDGRVFVYQVKNGAKAREHAYQITTEGYRHNDGTVYEYYPVHRIKKVKVVGKISTKYTDKVRGT